MPFSDLDIHKKQIFSQQRFNPLSQTNELAFSKENFEMPSVVNDHYIQGIQSSFCESLDRIPSNPSLSSRMSKAITSLLKKRFSDEKGVPKRFSKEFNPFVLVAS